MGGMADDFCYGGINPARGASHLASAGAGGRAHSAGELFYRLVSLSRSQARQNATARPGAAGAGRDALSLFSSLGSDDGEILSSRLGNSDIGL